MFVFAGYLILQGRSSLNFRPKAFYYKFSLGIRLLLFPIEVDFKIQILTNKLPSHV